MALTTAPLPYALQLAHQGLDVLRTDSEVGKGVNTYRGFVTSNPWPNPWGCCPSIRSLLPC